MTEKVGGIELTASIDTTGAVQAGKVLAKTADQIAADLAKVAAAAEEAAKAEQELAAKTEHLSRVMLQSAKNTDQARAAYQANTAKILEQRAAQEEARKPVDQMVLALKEQAETLGMNARQLILYKAAQAGATVEQKKALIQSLNQIDSYRRKTEATQKANMAMSQTATAVGQATGSMGNMRHVAGNLGYQLQDIAVQAQMGTSAFVILGQQGSQVASAFGPGGAVFGAVIAIASAIGGVLYASLQKAKTGMIDLSEESKKRLEVIKQALGEVDEESKSAFTQVELGKINTEYDAQAKKIEALQARLKQYLQMTKSGSQGAAIEAGRIGRQIEGANKKLKELAELQERVTAEVLKSKNGWQGVTEEEEKSSDAVANLALQIQAATIKITEGELAARRFSAAQVLGLKAGEALPPAIDAAIVKLYELEEAQRRDNEAAKERVRQAGELEKTLDRIASAEDRMQKQFDRDEELKIKVEEDQRRKVTTEFQQVQTGIRGDMETPAQTAARELEERLAVIRQYGEQENLTKEQIRDYELQAEAAHQKQITDIRKQEEQMRRQTMQATLGAVGDMFGNLAEIAKEGGEKSFNSWKAMASAQAAISAALAVINTMASVPFPFNIAASTAIGALAAVQIGKIQGQQYSGGRLYGGPVQAGGMYRVTEDGKPEILQQGNQQYLLPGNNGGKVVSNKEMATAGGSGGITINYSPVIYAQETDFETIMASQPEAIMNVVRSELAREGRNL
jgi:hypothetical protein